MNIDKNVPLPNKGVSGKNNFIADLDVGDSIYIDDIYARDRIRAAFKYRNIPYISRREGEGWRIWRSD